MKCKWKSGKLTADTESEWSVFGAQANSRRLKSTSIRFENVPKPALLIETYFHAIDWLPIKYASITCWRIITQFRWHFLYLMTNKIKLASNNITYFKWMPENSGSKSLCINVAWIFSHWIRNGGNSVRSCLLCLFWFVWFRARNNCQMSNAQHIWQYLSDVSSTAFKMSKNSSFNSNNVKSGF